MSFPRQILSPKFLREYSPSEFLEYIKDLGTSLIPPKREAPKAPDINIRINRKGNLVIRVRNRDPKYVTPEEFQETRTKLDLPSNILDLALRERKIHIRTHDEAKAILAETRSIPW